MSSVCLAPANVVALSTMRATRLPSGDRYAGVGPWIGYVWTVAPVQLRTRTWLNVLVSHSAPAAVAAPIGMHEVPPSVNRRPAVAGSTTCSSCGRQHPGTPPWVQVGTLATIRLLVPCHPIGHRV